jgi:hemolysin activation/secretion protein
VTRPAPAVALAVLACSASLAARAAEQAPPGAGDILQQMKPNVPPPPQSPVTGLSIRREDGASLPPGEAFAVTSLQIVGNTRFSTAELHALVAASEGKRLNLAELTGVAAIITD